jgi:uncharacterized phage protein (TIGR01671 family)
MREILFKAFDKEQKRFFDVYGFDEDHVYENTLDDYTRSIHPRGVCDLMQYTGLKDKNGEKIFADIHIVKFKFMRELRASIELIGIFHYNEDSLRYEIEVFDNRTYTVLNYPDNGRMYDFEIIGTKQDNPELIGGTK